MHCQKPYIIKIRDSARNICTSRSIRSGDTSYIGPHTCECRCVSKLQHYQDTYIAHCTKLAVKGHQDHTD